jgi:tetratricopeptide (TPR) repeat protein
VDAPSHVSAAAATVSTKWETRRLALLRIELVPTSQDSLLAPEGPVVVAIDKVQVFGGRIEERSSTGLLASFGLDPDEDAPERAAHTALALEKAAERARADGQPVAMSTAIHVGRFQVDFGAAAPLIDPESQRQARVMLDALLVADRDTITVSELASASLERHFELLPLPASRDSGPRAYRLVGRAQSGRRQGRLMATFVGRDNSLDLLERHAAAAMAGQGQVIGLVGDAGIGKSRLVAEFRERLAHREVTYLEGACFSYASTVPYLPVLTILRQTCGIGESASAEKTIESIRGRLDAIGMNVEESAPYLYQLFGLPEELTQLAPLTPEAIRLGTIETLRRMILAASRQQPIVMVLEDLHWTDKGSEEVLTSLVADVPGAPIMFLSTYRPGFRPPWIEKSFATQIALSPLSSEDSRTIVRALLPGEVSDSMVGMILDKAEGNPFFLEEMCRAVAQEGTPDGIRAVPDTIEEILLTRIQRLPDDTRSVIEVAAVLGREFPPDLLQSVWHGPGALDAHIRRLADLEFVHRRATGREPAYAFKHALTQQVAYDTLPSARRRELHAAAGRALEATYADRLDEAYDRLAYHYSKTEEAVKAVDYLCRFAEKAARSYAHGAAVQACHEALQHIERLPADGRDRRRIEVILRLPDSLLPLGRIGESIAMLVGEHDRLERLRDPALAARYYFDLSRAYMLGNHALGAENARRAIAEAERCGDRGIMGGAYGVLTVVCALSGQAPLGIECGQRAVALLDASPEQWHLCYACWALGLCWIQTGAFAECLAIEGRALAIAQAIGDSALEVSASWVMGVTHAAMGEWDQGISECRHAVNAARNVLYRAFATGFLGFAYMEKGDAKEAIPMLEQSIPLVHQFGNKVFEGWFTAFLAEANRMEGRLDHAESLAEHGRLIATEANYGIAVGWAQLSLGRTAMARGEWSKATDRIEQALATFTGTHSRYECARAHMDLAAAWHARGSAEAATRHLSEAHALLSVIGAVRHRERVEHLAADWGVPLAPGTPQ